MVQLAQKQIWYTPYSIRLTMFPRIQCKFYPKQATATPSPSQHLTYDHVATERSELARRDVRQLPTCEGAVNWPPSPSRHSIGTMPCSPRVLTHNAHPSSYSVRMYTVSPGVIASSSGSWGTNVTRTSIGTSCTEADPCVDGLAGATYGTAT